MKKTPAITNHQVKYIAGLANIPITQAEQNNLTHALQETLKSIEELHSVNINNIEPTHQVTGLENVLREDIVDTKNMFTQQEALANAKKTHAGYFVVPRIIEEK